jgi:hypothetical protein
MASHVASGNERGCPLANAAVELRKGSPGTARNGAFKTAQRKPAAELAKPEMLAKGEK